MQPYILALAIALSGAINSNIEEPPLPLTEAQVIEQELKDHPILKEICRCESGLVHTKEDGTLIVGIVNPKDRGICQINLPSHQDTLTEMNLDPDKLLDNLTFAKYLYSRDGTKPWNASKSCWKDKI